MIFCIFPLLKTKCNARFIGWPIAYPLILTFFFACIFTTPHISVAQQESTSTLLKNGSPLPLNQEYNAAKTNVAQLEQDTTRRTQRGEWLKIVKQFHKIHLAEKKNSLGPPSLFQMSKIYRKMYDQFKLLLDLENSTTSYLDLTQLYPAHSLADDALFNIAENLTVAKHTSLDPKNIYTKIVEVYPKSDHYTLAVAKLNQGDSAKQNSVKTVGEMPEKPDDKAAVTIQPVKYWSSADYSRIVIPASGQVEYKTNLIEPAAQTPARLSIDFTRSRSSGQTQDPLTIQDGLLKQVRTGQFNDETVRVVLDFESLSDYQIFTLSDPFRVIVDIHRKQPLKENVIPAQAQQPSLAVTQAESAKPVTRLEDKEKPSKLEIITLTDQKKSKANAPVPGKALKKNEISLAQQLGLGIKRIVIDPGHGGKDPGAMAFGLKEKDIVLAVAQKAAKILKNKYNYDVSLTRTKDFFIPLEERTAIANTRKCDLFLSIHVNAHPDNTIGGIETYFLNLATNADAMRVAAIENATSTHNISELQDILTDLMKNSKIDESSRLAQFVHTNLITGMVKKYKTRDLGVKQAPFYVLIGAEMPAILAEISFITNPTEAKLLQDDRYLNQIAEQLASGVLAYVEHHRTAALGYNAKSVSR